VNVTNQPAALRGANVLLAWVLTEVALFVVQTVAFRVLKADGEQVLNLFQLTWFAMGVWFAVGLIFIATAVDRPGLIWTVVALSVVGSMLSLAVAVARIFDVGLSVLSVLSVPEMLIGLAERVGFLVVVVRLCGSSRPWALMVAMVAGTLSVVRLALSFSFTLRFVGLGSIMGWYPMVSGIIGVLGLACTVALTIGVRAAIAEGGQSAPTASPVVPLEERPVSPAADFGIGAALLLGGVVVSVASYSLASSGSGGGRYVVATGLIGVGIGRLIRGMIRASKQ